MASRRKKTADTETTVEREDRKARQASQRMQQRKRKAAEQQRDPEIVRQAKKLEATMIASFNARCDSWCTICAISNVYNLGPHKCPATCIIGSDVGKGPTALCSTCEERVAGKCPTCGIVWDSWTATDRAGQILLATNSQPAMRRVTRSRAWHAQEPKI